tara:strand:- start:560 stop:1048 length:489 start_codon:yes stop_codon:yes gene_type:complete
MASLRPLKILYTGVWASGYMRGKSAFSRISITDIDLIVDIDNRFVLRAQSVEAEDRTLAPFCLTGTAKVVYEDSGMVKEILLSSVSYDNVLLEDNTFSVTRTKCTRLPIPYGEAFFCFSSRISKPQLDFLSFPMVDEKVEDDLEEMSFDDIFDAFTPIDYCK